MLIGRELYTIFDGPTRCVPRTGIEPARLVEGHWILSPACLPISASRHTTRRSAVSLYEGILHQNLPLASSKQL